MQKLLTVAAILLTTTFAHAEMTKETVVDEMEVLENGCVQVRQAVRVYDGDTLISQRFHRYVVSPGDDYSKRSAKVKAVCAKVHTPDVIADYKDSISENPTETPVTPGLVKETKVGKVHILEDGTMVVETVTQVLDDGKVIGKSVVREKIMPGNDTTGKAQRVKDLVSVIHTKDVVDAYKAKHGHKKVEVVK